MKGWFDDHPRPAELQAILGPDWAICRKTPANLARYSRCITHREYEAACIEALKRRALAA